MAETDSMLDPAIRQPLNQVEVVDTLTLTPHPDQSVIYGDIGGAHDPSYIDLRASIVRSGILQPLIVSRDTPDLLDGTVISGHRRLAAAVDEGLTEVPVIYQQYETAVHARRAHLECNRSREKDEWVKTQEVRAWWEVEAALAAMRQEVGRPKEGASRTSGTSAGSSKGDTRDAVASRLGEGAKTTELRKKLADKAAEQSPENPSESPIAKDLKAGKAVKTVAREHGVIPKKPKEKNGKAKKHRPIDDVLEQLKTAATIREIESAYGFAAKLATNGEATPKELDVIQDLYIARKSELETQSESDSDSRQEPDSDESVAPSPAATTPVNSRDVDDDPEGHDEEVVDDENDESEEFSVELEMAKLHGSLLQIRAASSPRQLEKLHRFLQRWVTRCEEAMHVVEEVH